MLVTVYVERNAEHKFEMSWV